jgi:hypothetical protein
MPRPDSSVVERGPEKAGVGGSIPSLATILESIIYTTQTLASHSGGVLAFLINVSASIT